MTLKLTAFLVTPFLCLILGCARPAPAPREKTTPQTTSSPEEQLLDRFVEAVNARKQEAKNYLGPPPLFEEKPLSEKQADALYAEFYLHHPELRVLSIRKGEPAADGSMKATPGRYTLVTKVQGSTPALRIRNDQGVVESPSRLFMLDPDLVVEVRQGKIFGLRAELHRK